MSLNLNSISSLRLKLRRNLKKNIFKVNFSNKRVELINLPALLNNSELISLLKELLHYFVNPTVICSSSIFH